MLSDTPVFRNQHLDNPLKGMRVNILHSRTNTVTCTQIIIKQNDTISDQSCAAFTEIFVRLSKLPNTRLICGLLITTLLTPRIQSNIFTHLPV